MATALLTTKLYAPPVRPARVPRPQLAERVRRGIAGKLTLLVAPAGFGKTTLLSEAIGGQPVAWVSLDRGDSDATRFWSYVLAALNTIAPGISDTTLALLAAPQPPAPEALLTTLLNALSELDTHAVLVLDDYHVIDTPSIHDGLAFLLEHLSPRLHIVIASRADPPLQLARMRARAELTELRAADLRFTTDQSTAFLTDLMGLPLSASDISVLDARTEGWIAGLHLAALAMRGRSDLSGFITAFTGSNRFVMDYLVEEVLERLPQHLQRFVMQTAILDRMCGALCDSVIEPAIEDELAGAGLESGDAAPNNPFGAATRPVRRPASSQHLLEELERANLFVLPLDDNRHWYRYHHLFAEVVRRRLESFASAPAVAALHQRAGAWYEHQGLVPEAVQHALAAGDYECAGRLVEQHGVLLAVRGQVHTVLGWLNTFPVARLRNDAMLALTHAVVLLIVDRLAESEARLQDAERSARSSLPPEQLRIILGRVAATRATIVRFSGDIAQCVELSQQALELLPATEQLWRTPALVNAARAYLLTGNVKSAAEQAVAATIAPARDSGSLFSHLAAVINLARLQVLQGRLREAAATYAQAAQVTEHGPQRLLNSAAYFFGLGDLLREWNDLDAAEQHLRQGLDLVGGSLSVDAEFLLLGYVALARVLEARGAGAAARTTLDTVAQLSRQRPFAPLLLAHLAAAQARLALAEGDLAGAAGWAETCGLHADDPVSFPRETEYITLAQVLLARAGSETASTARSDALGLLDRLQRTAEANGRVGSVIEISIVRALALDGQDNTAALAELERALTLAEPGGYVRSFVDRGAALAALLEGIRDRAWPVAAYAAGVLQAFPRRARDHEQATFGTEGPSPAVDCVAADQLVEPLTEREHEILRLIADGHSNQAIADQLVVAVSTVKKHINNLYGKLAVQSRTQALVRARELALL